MDAKKLNALIKTIGANAAKAREQIQQALIGCAYQATFHRNTDPFNRLFDAVGNGTRREGMLKWASVYAPVHFNKGEVKLSDARQKEMVSTLTEAQFSEEMAASPIWCDMAKPEPIENPWDSTRFVETLAAYLETAAKKAVKNGDDALASLIRGAEQTFRKSLNDDKYGTLDLVEVRVDGKAVSEDEASAALTESIRQELAKS